MFGSEIKIGLSEMIIIAAVLVVVALFMDPATMSAKLRAVLGNLVPFLRSKELPAVMEEADTFLDLHARLTLLSIEEGGAYNGPLGELYTIYLDRQKPASAAKEPALPLKKKGDDQK